MSLSFNIPKLIYSNIRLKAYLRQCPFYITLSRSEITARSHQILTSVTSILIYRCFPLALERKNQLICTPQEIGRIDGGIQCDCILVFSCTFHHLFYLAKPFNLNLHFVRPQIQFSCILIFLPTIAQQLLHNKTCLLKCNLI